MSLSAVRFPIVAVAALAVAVGACSNSTEKQGRPSAESAASQNHQARSGRIIVSAAASTKEVMERLAEQFKAKTGTLVSINLGPSSGLASQIIAGAPADLFLSANQQWADEVEKHGDAEVSARLLTNRLVIVVPADNPGEVKAPTDLLSPGVRRIALAGEKVPAGMYAQQALAELKLLDLLVAAGKIVRGEDVRVTLSHVKRGEVDAGIVYSTDARAAGDIKIVHEFDPSLHDEIVYVLVLLKAAKVNPVAREFYKYLQSAEAELVYPELGFSRLR